MALIDRVYSTVRKKLSNGEWGMSGLGSLSDSPYKKVIFCRKCMLHHIFIFIQQALIIVTNSSKANKTHSY
jgi:hypothetical protein